MAATLKEIHVALGLGKILGHHTHFLTAWLPSKKQSLPEIQQDNLLLQDVESEASKFVLS